MSQTQRWIVAIFKEAPVTMKTWQPHKYPSPLRLIVPLAVKRRGDVIEIVEPVWTQCHCPSVAMCDCAVYFPYDIDAIIYLKDGWTSGAKSMYNIAATPVSATGLGLPQKGYGV